MAQPVPATQDEAVARLRTMVGEEDLDNSSFTGDRLWDVCQRHTTLEGAAAEVWVAKAAIYAELVNTREAGSSRDLGKLHENALRMASTMNSAAIAPEPAPTSGRTRIHQIYREGDA